jgi:2-hydroxychromene-2-carboxylate isomerase
MQMAPKEGKELLGKNTDQALAEGAFGLPYFVAENSNGEKDKIWGVDHMGVLVQHLGIEKPRMGGWKALL